MGKTYGYVRVSSADQNTHRQLIAMRERGVPERNIYVDKQSGKDFDRPAYRRLVKRLRPGDLLVVKSIDRLGRDYHEIQEQWRMICREKKVDIQVLDMPLLDTSTAKDLLGAFISDLVLQLLSFVAENERQYIRQRQAEGIAAAKARGVHMGRPRLPLPEDFPQLAARWREGRMTTAQLADRCGMSTPSVRARLREMGVARPVPPDGKNLAPTP